MQNIYLRFFIMDLIRIGAAWRFDYVQDTFWRFYFNSSDGAAVWIGGRELPLLRNRLYFIPSGVSFTGRNTHPIDHFYVHFDVIGLPPHLQRRLQADLICLDRHERLQTILSEILADFSDSAPADDILQLRVKSILYEALALFFASIPEDYSPPNFQNDVAPLQAALDWIDSHLGDRLPVGDLARRCHISEDYFIKRFRACIGQTPNRYIQSRRIIAAAQDLLFTSATIDLIAERNGFANRFYFARVFSKHTGLSPAAYRKASRV